MLSLINFSVLLALYLVSVAIYRLYFSPLAKFPGPKIAALTSWYCAYHDIMHGGRYIWVIEEMHRKYGPVVRIMPSVLHINDPSFIDKLYPQSPNVRRERAQTMLNMSVLQTSMLFTRDHNLHRQRRNALSRFFSQQSVRRLVPVINNTLGDLLQCMASLGREGGIISLNEAYRAATKDVIQAYALGDGRKCLLMDDLNAPFFEIMRPRHLSHISVHAHWFPVALAKLPMSIILKMMPAIAGYIDFIQDLGKKLDQIRDSKDHSEGVTIFQEVLRSDLPDSEKATERLVEEAQVLAIAGSDTTAATLISLTYHVLSDRTIFKRLRGELESVIPDANQPPDPAKLESLQFLNALVEEAIRLYPGGTHRQDRVAPDQDLVYQYPEGRAIIIPAGTSIGMTAPLVNRSPLWYQNPDEFNPDRYLENPEMIRRHLTFSKGARQCIGINLAYQELRIFTAGIFRKYSPYDASLKQQTGPTLELYRTKIEDVQLYSDFVTPEPYPGSHGLRVRVRQG